MFFYLIAGLLAPVFAFAFGSSPEVKVFSAGGQLEKTFSILTPDYNGAVDLASGDTNGDGKSETIVAGAGSAGVEIYDGAGLKLNGFMAYPKFNGNINVASADVNGDNQNEIITSAGYGGGPHVRVFEQNGESSLSFFAFSSKERVGASVAAGDLGQDGKAEIIAFSYLNRQPEVAVFGNDGHLITKHQLKNLNNNGIVAIVGDFNGDSNKEMAISGKYGTKAQVMIFDWAMNKLSEFTAVENYTGGLNLSSGDINNDGKSEIIITQSFNGSGKVFIFAGDGSRLSEFEAYGAGFNAGLKTAVGDFDGDGQKEIAVAPERIRPADLRRNDYKFIEVNIDQQKLRYFQDGKMLGEFLISSGLKKTPTPLGEFSIYRKRPNVRMTWYYGYNNPMNYDLPNVLWVSSFKGPYTIHGAYWHNNFGHPMSHGCVNMKNAEAKIIYDLVDIGTPVTIY